MAITLCCAAEIYAQKNTNKVRPPVFSSVYSDVAKGKSCKTIEAEIIGCRAVGNYQLFASFHNVSENVWIETLDGEKVAGIPSDKQPGISRNVGKFEWRLANGKPFAVIARFEFYMMEDVEAGRDLSADRSKFAQILVIKGLPGNEQIDFELDARLAANSNQKARDLADEAFMKKPETASN